VIGDSALQHRAASLYRYRDHPRRVLKRCRRSTAISITPVLGGGRKAAPAPRDARPGRRADACGMGMTDQFDIGFS